MASAIQEHNVESEPAPTAKSHGRFRPHFRLRTLLVAPVLVAMLLFIIFPKLLTGDFADATVVSIQESGKSVTIEFEVLASSQTDLVMESSYGPFSSAGIGGGSLPQWGRLLPTWPRRSLMSVNLGLNRKRLPTDGTGVIDLVKIKEGERIHIAPDHPVVVAAGKTIDGQEGKCSFTVQRGNRLGL